MVRVLVGYCRFWAWVGLAETVGFVGLGLGDEYVHLVRHLRLFASHPFARLAKEDKERLFKTHDLDDEAGRDRSFKFRMAYSIELDDAGDVADGLGGLAGEGGGGEEEEEEELWGDLVLGGECKESESQFMLDSDDTNDDRFDVVRGRFGTAGGGRGFERRALMVPALVRRVLPARWTRKVEKVAGRWLWRLRLWHMCLRQLPVTRALLKSVNDAWWIHAMPRLLALPRFGSWLAWLVGVRGARG